MIKRCFGCGKQKEAKMWAHFPEFLVPFCSVECISSFNEQNKRIKEELNKPMESGLDQD